MIKADKYYVDNLMKILEAGQKDSNPRPRYKDGTPAHSFYITQVYEEYDISLGEYPIPTLRNTAVKTGYREMLWIYQQQTSDLSKAKELGINWWGDWDVGNGTIGQRYGATVKAYNLMNELIDGLIWRTFERRHMIDLYQYADFKQTKGLHPCAFLSMWTPRITNGKLYLDMTLVQRSNDYIMAGYINKIQYVALMKMVCAHMRWCGIEVQEGVFAHFTQNLHIYDRHIDAAQEILERDGEHIQSILIMPESKNFYDFAPEDVEVTRNNAKKLTKNLEIAI